MWIVAGCPQHVDDLLAMLGPAGLDADVELDLAELQADAVPRVQHLDDIGVRLGEKLCDAGELARTVGKHDA